MEERRKEALVAAGCAVETVSTGSLGLDIALGMGGLPRGCVVEVFGPEGAGRTTLALQVIAEVQRSGGAAAFVDAEGALDASYAQKLGVDIDDLVVSRPYSGEQALEITEMLVRSRAVDIVVVDSVAALTPRAEIESAMGAAPAGLQARLMWRALRRLNRHISRSKAVVVFINQIRTKIGMFGSTEVTIGGEALACYASVRLDVRRVGLIKKGDEVTGNLTRVRVVKKEFAPRRETQFEILFGHGISREGEIIDLAGPLGIVSKSGGYWYKGKRIGEGQDEARAYLTSNAAMAREIEEQVRARLLPVRRSRAPDVCQDRWTAVPYKSGSSVPGRPSA